jgi:hypothetical protein
VAAMCARPPATACEAGACTLAPPTPAPASAAGGAS